MPELPEVETVKCGLQRVLEGRVLRRVIARRSDLRFPLPDDFGQRLTGRNVRKLSRRAKYLLVHLDNGTVLIWHLGMSGRVLIFADPPPPEERHDHIIIETDQGVTIRFNDTRRFGFMDLCEACDLENHPMIAKLGPEPLAEEFDGDALARRLAGRKTPIKAALLDQSVVAGLGNIYVSESLYHAGISPRRAACTVQGGRAEKLAQAIRQVLRAAIKAGGSSLRDYARTSGEPGYFQHQFAVYDKAGQKCPGCDCSRPGIQQIVQSGRSTYFCPHRQR